MHAYHPRRMKESLTSNPSLLRTYASDKRYKVTGEFKAEIFFQKYKNPLAKSRQRERERDGEDVIHIQVIQGAVNV